MADQNRMNDHEWSEGSIGCGAAFFGLVTAATAAVVGLVWRVVA